VRRDDRVVLLHSSVMKRFHLEGGITYLCEFSFVKIDLILDSDQFSCRLKGPKRR
jgi:hypothetical protein